ncbi:carbonic anhydrase [Aspergillus keveii]|uniref:Carbonic anhydrase n=1 Tax=Aspergillus keveii TaxID=714993 RepID=A0ABR4FML4_9EURO
MTSPNPAALTTLLERNAAYAKTHTPILTNAEIKASGILAYKTLIITCTDGRIRPEKFLGIENPHEFLISRNSGARARPALANLLALDDLVGLETVLVIGHTDCGAHNFDEDAIKERLSERASKAPAPSDSRREIEALEFGKIEGSIEQSVQGDVNFLKESPLVRGELKGSIFGLVFDIHSGELVKVA